MQPFEVIEVNSLEVSCDGGMLGHPKVYLHIDPDAGNITCPYCSRQYMLRQLATRAGNH